MSAAAEPTSRAGWVRPVALLIGGVTLARLFYLAFLCPYTLVEDEAWYWEWSRRLEWSYYSKGPGVAWTIRAFTELFGVSEFTVRLGAVLFSALTAVAIAGLAADIAGLRRDARGESYQPNPALPNRLIPFYSVACFFLAPIFQTTGLMMTIDGPYAACWAFACWTAWRALKARCRGAWLGLGLALGAGFLYKYTILLLLPGVLLFALLEGRALRTARPRWAWALLAALIFGVCTLPVLLWNQQHGWPTLAHLLGHLGLKGGDMPVTQGDGGWRYSPLWTLNYVGSQLALVGPVLLLAGVEAWRAVKNRGAAGSRWSADLFLICCSAPLLLFYLAVSFVAEPEGNWALGAYLTASILAGKNVAHGLPLWREKVRAWRALPSGQRPRAGLFRRQPETPTQVLWHAALVIGCAVALATLRLDLVSRAVNTVKTWPGFSAVIPAKAYIPVGRFMGADRMGEHAARLLADLRSQTDQDPFLAALHYGRAAQLAYYTPGRPNVVCPSSVIDGGRRTHYDFWPDTRPLDRPDLLGRPALVVGGTRASWEPYFERVEPIDPGDSRLEGDGKRNRPAFRAYGFRGFEQAPAQPPAGEAP